MVLKSLHHTLGLLLLIWPQHALAAVLLESDMAAFLVSAPIESTTSFRGQPKVVYLGSTVTVDSIIYDSPGDISWIDNGPDDRFADGFGSNNVDPDILSFGCNRYVNAIGFHMTHGRGIYGSQIEVVEVNHESTIFKTGPTGPNTDLYYGFRSNVGIRYLIIGDDPDDSGISNRAYNDVSRSSIFLVPEPTCLYNAAILAWVWMLPVSICPTSHRRRS